MESRLHRANVAEVDVIVGIKTHGGKSRPIRREAIQGEQRPLNGFCDRYQT